MNLISLILIDVKNAKKAEKLHYKCYAQHNFIKMAKKIKHFVTFVVGTDTFKYLRKVTSAESRKSKNDKNKQLTDRNALV